MSAHRQPIVWQELRQRAAACLDFLSRHRLAVSFGLVYFLCSLYAMSHFLQTTLLGDRYARSAFDAMYNGTAWKPFVYRVLVPKLTWLITLLTPQFLQNAVTSGILALADKPFIHQLFPWFSPLFSHIGTVYPRMVAALLVYASLIGYMRVMFLMSGRLFPEAPALRWFSPIFAALSIADFSNKPWRWCQYIYDIPTLFLSAACYLCILRGTISGYFTFFTLACLNKESAIFVFLFFAVWCYPRVQPRRFASLCLAQLLIFIVIKLVVSYLYGDNPGPILDYNLHDVMQHDVLARTNYPALLNLAVLFWLVTWQWESKPAFLKTVLWIFPVVYVAFLLYGKPGEYRVFFDILPLLLLLGVHTLIGMSGLNASPFFRREGEVQHEPMG